MVKMKKLMKELFVPVWTELKAPTMNSIALRLAPLGKNGARAKGTWRKN